MYVYIAAFLLLLGIVGSAYFYFTYSQNKIETLAQQLVAVQAETATATALNQALQADIEKIKQLTEQNNKRVSQIEQQAAKTPTALAKHNLQSLANKKPKLLEDTINKNTNAFWHDLEIQSR